METKKFQYNSSLFSGRVIIAQLPPGMSASEQPIGGRPPGANAIQIHSITTTARGYCNGTTYSNLPFGLACFNDIFTTGMANALAGWMFSIPLVQNQSTYTNGIGQVATFTVTYQDGEGPIMIGTQPNVSAINLSGATTGFGIDGTIDIAYEWVHR